MSRYNKPVETTPEEISELAESIRTIAASFDQQVEFIKAKNLGVLMVPKWSTASDGLKAFASFAAGIQDAIVKARVMNSVDEKVKASAETEDDSSKKTSKSKPKRNNNPD